MLLEEKIGVTPASLPTCVRCPDTGHETRKACNLKPLLCRLDGRNAPFIQTSLRRNFREQARGASLIGLVIGFKKPMGLKQGCERHLWLTGGPSLFHESDTEEAYLL